MFGPQTPGTLVVLAAAVLLVLVSISTPILKDFYFLSADVEATVSSVTLKGNIKLGVFGYCIVLGSQDACSPVTLGYALDPNSLLSLPQDTNLGISSTVLKNLTYVLILHPIAAGLAVLAVIFGLLSHIREFSRTCWTSFFASLATTVALIAFVFDIVAFSIAKSKIVEAATNAVGTNAQLGLNVWLTLAAWVALASSSCFFCVGRCLIRKRRRHQREADQLRPIADQAFADQMRYDATEAEKAREQKIRLNPPTAGLPAFAEYGNEHVRHEEIPLNRFNVDDETYSDHHALLAPRASVGPYASPTSLTGVGVGYGRRPSESRYAPPGSYPEPRYGEPGSHASLYSQASYSQPQQSHPPRQNLQTPYGQQLHIPSPYYTPPHEMDARMAAVHRQNSEQSGYYENPSRHPSYSHSRSPSRTVVPHAMPDHMMWNGMQPEADNRSYQPTPNDHYTTHAPTIEYMPPQADNQSRGLPLPGEGHRWASYDEPSHGNFINQQPRHDDQDYGQPEQGDGHFTHSGPYVEEPDRIADDFNSNRVEAPQPPQPTAYSNHPPTSVARGQMRYEEAEADDAYGGVSTGTSPRRPLPSVPTQAPLPPPGVHQTTTDYNGPDTSLTPPPGYR
ncbi:uncharacterized protein MELLADRAFT_87634 [Melampsora larici-populina 98AG31]|uniref:Pali-domain-containing protein n=1 Tax=Melampsora larici-populina (strain 98AG31 / pathotype 3-4-7) TaxID=747676 RepID=F4RP51_MELLP|nr:uncharacterized protein MELLADRAFT_87634 [Melampsora larici-populina 98AG31]EGG05913.1 hypothetical protein MELLADRAFT_87634 [Melampsora larici-populina 98AG31]